jgi:hypothetical protein
MTTTNNTKAFKHTTARALFAAIPDWDTCNDAAAMMEVLRHCLPASKFARVARDATNFHGRPCVVGIRQRFSDHAMAAMMTEVCS